jgi:hypothetical protein
MKKNIFTLSLIASCLFAYAQEKTVTLLTFGGYTFKDKIDFGSGYYGEIGDGFQYGAGFEVGLSDENAVEIIYQRMDPKTFVQGLNQRETGEIGINYIMLGGTRYAPINEKLAGFATLDAGVGFLSPKETSLDGVTKFAWGLRLGLRMMTSEKVSLRIHAQLMSPVQGAGGGFYLGTGGAGAGVSTYSSIYQFNFGASVNFRLK